MAHATGSGKSGDLAGKVVLVTGGAKNVGKAISRRFAERGAHVVVNFFHSLEAARDTVAELRAEGFSAESLRASVARQAQVERMFDEIEARHGRLDVLVNNAASGALLGIDEIGEEHFDRAIDTNLKGAFWCARRAASLMARNGGGAIVNVSSVGATLVPANYLVVGTSKAALESLTRYLAVEYAGQHIRVNTASATLIDGSVADLFPDAENTRRSSIAATPMKRLAQPDELADLVLFLASDAARWITGQVVVADGGLSLCSEGLSPRPQAQGLPQQALQPAVSAPPSAATAPSAASPAAPGLETDDIAIVGMGLALPGANDVDAFWKTLMEGTELFGAVPPDRWDYRSFHSPDASAEDKSYQSRSVFIEGFAAVDALQAEIDRGSAPGELTTLWLRHALMQAMAGVRLRAQDRSSFLVGYTADGSQHLEEAMVLAATRQRLQALLDEAGAAPDERERCLAEVTAVLQHRYRRGASGLAEFFPHRVGLAAMQGVLPDDAECMMVDTACSSSLYSIDIGIKSLLLGQKDVAVCGGAFALAPRGSVLFSKLHGLSRSGEVRPLDKDCDGVLFADGAGVVVLKRLQRAQADGDTVLAVIKSFGSSSDGKGKAIYAPNSAGQSIAIRRAYEAAAPQPQDIDWVVAHATGTPAGDVAEFHSLREMLGHGRPVQVTSNKSLVGHTGWAAGVVSLIQVVLGLRHGVIPPQHRFAEAPAAFGIDECQLQIPTAAVPWPRRPGSARMAAVSGFGFGGTNGHLVVSEYRPELPAAPGRPLQADEPLVVVGWSSRFPGLQDDDAVAAWLRGAGAAPASSFGDTYPLPPFTRVRMPGAVLRALDRCQLMALDAAHELRERIAGFWQAHADRIGVVMGHMGPTRNAALYASRCYLDDIDTALQYADPAVHRLLAALRERTRSLVPATTENSFPGMMPNVIPARVANYHDLHGANLTVDAGHASTLAALQVASRYLRCGGFEMVLVGGINGNSAEEVRPAFDAPLAEGVVLFAVTTAAKAAAAGLPVLATLDVDAALATLAPPSPKAPPVTYAGADGAVGLLSALVRGADEVVVARNPGDRDRFAVRIRPATVFATTSATTSATASPAAEASAAPAAAVQPAVPAWLSRADVAADGEPLGVRRHRIEWTPTPWAPGPQPVLPFVPQGCVIVTDDPALVLALPALQADTVVLCSVPLPVSMPVARPGWHHLPQPDAQAVQALLPPGTRHVRLLSSMGAGALLADPRAEVPPAPGRLALHDLAFLAVKACAGALAEGGSGIALLLDAAAGGLPHPDAGLFSGLVKALAIEKPGARWLTVFTETAQVAEAVAQAEQESAGLQLLPVVLREGPLRFTPRVVEDAGTPADAGALPLLDERSVVVAIGGARGITAELMKAVAQAWRPTLYLIGSSVLEGHPPETFAGSDEDFAGRRADFIRTSRAADPGLPIPTIIRSFERLLELRTARRNIEAMRAHCGPARVHYLCADVMDAASLEQAVAQILARESKVDLLVNAAGLNRSASVGVKSFNDFQAVRDIKVRGNWNLRAAFAARPPRAWCNFGSFIGLTGQAGETDYAAGNDFLNTQAQFRRRHRGADEFTIGWTLWRSVGLGANPVTRAFLEKSGLFTSMRTEEGVHHFLRELCLRDRAAASVHLGAPERQAIAAHLPTFFNEAATPAPASPDVGRFYLGSEVDRGPSHCTVERVFDLQADGYLQHHRVNGFATLPGTFVTELAAEAAMHLVPGLKVVGFEDAVFHHFLRVYDAGRPSTKRIAAQVVQRDGDLTVVQVRITGDVTSPAGVVLVRDKLHFEIKALLAPRHEVAPTWPQWPAQTETPVPDPYHMASAPVRLTRMFVSTTATRSTPMGKRARFALDMAPDDAVFSRFLMPCMLLDGLARVAALNLVAGDYIPLAAPASIRRIDLYEEGNDLQLAQRHPAIELYATPKEFALEGAGSRNRFVAALPDGRMVAQMKDVTGVVIGYVHRHSGAFVSKAEVDALPQAALQPGLVPA